jgi:hypothetical protein
MNTEFTSDKQWKVKRDQQLGVKRLIEFFGQSPALFHVRGRWRGGDTYYNIARYLESYH